MAGDPSREEDRPPSPENTSLWDLRSLPEAELVRRHREVTRGHAFGPDDFLNELARREMLRQNRQLAWLTGVLAILTVAIVILVAVLLWSETLV